MRRVVGLCIPLLLGWIVPAQVHTGPLPDPAQLKQRALANMKRAEKDLERYECIVHDESDELNGGGGVKRHRSSEKEQFFVNGRQVSHMLRRDGQPLSGGDAKKEQERVDREVKRFSDPTQVTKAEEESERQADMFLRAQRFANGHREVREGRSTVVYDMSGDPNFHPTKVEERFAQAASGRVWIDEESGAPAELRLQLDHDVKLGGGLLANIHKGFWVHMVQQRQADGVWLTKLVEGSGEARAALFFHPRIRFKQATDKCHLFSVDTQQTLPSPPPGK